MKKKILAVVLGLVLLFTFAACSNTNKRKPASGTQDQSYAVISNGGSVVQYGNYVYFINGFDGYEDEGKDNIFDEVEKGGLYRAELLSGTKTTRDYNFYYGGATLNVFNPIIDAQSGLSFKSTIDEYPLTYQTDESGEYILDDDGEKIGDIMQTDYVVDVELIVPKRIGTVGYEGGGIFIFDDYIFYASPNNQKNKSGKVQYLKTDFYRTTLDGSTTELIYTTENDSSTDPYMFYKLNGNYYLVAKDGDKLISVKMGNKIDDPKTIAQNVETAYMTTKDIYYNFTREGVNYKSFENGPEDYVFYTRTPNDNEVGYGNVIEMVRPDGNERTVIYADGSNATILNIDNGVLFYQVAHNLYGKAIYYTNLHSILMNKNSAYKQAYESGAITRAVVEGKLTFNVDSYSSFNCIYPNPRYGNEVYVIGFKSESIELCSNSRGKEFIAQGGGTFVKFSNTHLYYTTENLLKRVDLFNPTEPETVVSGAMTSVPFKFDLIDDFVAYFGQVDVFADQYALFKSLNDIESEHFFVGYRTESERRVEEEDKWWNNI